MTLPFIKLHGCGNDYVYIDCFHNKVDNPEELAIALSHRHFSIGGDGVILVCPSDIADARMRMFNSDGSEGKMCGNGIRCVAKFAYDNDLCKKEVMTIETLSGIKVIRLQIENGKAFGATVDMGAAILDPALIPTTFSGEPVIARPVSIGGKEWAITCVSMGNPHCIVFVEEDFDLWSFDIEKIGPAFEHAEIFPERVNTEFVKVISPTSLEMRVWERGSGETWACGTGTCASVVAACLNGHCAKGTDVQVKLRGGSLVINYTDSTVLMTGPATEAFRGTVEI